MDATVGLLTCLLVMSLVIIYWQMRVIQTTSLRTREQPSQQPTSPETQPSTAPIASPEGQQTSTELARLRAIVASTPDGVIVVDEYGTIELVNPDASYAFAYIPEELQGCDIRTILPIPGDDDGQPMQERFKNHIEHAGIGYRQECQGLKKNGELVDIELSIGEIRLPGSKRRFTCIVRNITERKKIEVMRQERISLVSHDLRDPLAAISGALRIMQHNAEERLSPQDLKMLNIASRNSDRLIQLINNLFDMELLDGKMLKITLNTVSLPTAIQKAISLVSQEADARGLKLSFHNAYPDAEALANEARLLQVMEHLLTNAIDASPSGTKIELGIQKKQERWEVSVTDQGPGIPMELRTHIFERFARGKQHGTGLGLCLSKAIVEKMGGSIEFTTAEGKGTTFRCAFIEANATMRKLMVNQDKGAMYI